MLIDLFSINNPDILGNPEKFKKNTAHYIKYTTRQNFTINHNRFNNGEPIFNQGSSA